jgi:GNAT superfamily N-acetyltransferase
VPKLRRHDRTFSEGLDKVTDSDETHQHCELPHRREALMVERYYSVRIATPADADAVTSLLLGTYPVLLAELYEAELLALALPLMTKANPRLLTSDTHYVAELANGQLVGCGGWTVERPGSGEVEPGLAHIRHFGTLQDWIRRGVGRALMVRSFADAKFRGVRMMECYSTLGAETFYRTLGFTIIGTYRCRDGARHRISCDSHAI